MTGVRRLVCKIRCVLVFLFVCCSVLWGQPSPAESLRLTLPPAIYATADVPISVYFDNLVLTQSPTDYRFDVTCDVGRVTDGRWELTATSENAGEHAFRVSVSTADGKLIESKSSVLKVTAADAGVSLRPIRLLIIGDSLTNASAYPNEIARLLAGRGNPKWTMLGTHKPASAKEGVAHEGYSGWRWQTFVTKHEPNSDGNPKNGSSPFLFPDQDGKPHLDMSRYFDQRCAGRRPDYIVILLGINDCFTTPVDNPDAVKTRIDSMLGFADTLLGDIHAAAPKARIGVCLTTPPNARQSAFEANYKDKYTRWGWKRIQHQLVRRQIDYIESKTDLPLSIVPSQLNIDPVAGYPVDNGVHPNAAGYQQIGASVFSWLKWQLASGIDGAEGKSQRSMTNDQLPVTERAEERSVPEHRELKREKPIGQSASSLHAPLPPEDAIQPSAGMGIMAGEVLDTSAIVQIRLTETDELVDRDVKGAWGVVEFSLRQSDQSSIATTLISYALPQRDSIARVQFTSLKPATKYVCDTRFGLTRESMKQGPSAEFRTHPGESVAKTVRFVVVTGMNYAKFHGDDRIDLKQHLLENNTKLPAPYAGADKHLGYPALETVLKLHPDFLIGTGDNVYYDTPDFPRAQTVTEMRQKWHEQFVQPRFKDLFAKVPTFWMVDDHDYRVDDGDNSGFFLPLPETARRILMEQLPYAPADEPAAPTYRTHRVSKDLQIWLPENRFYRSPNAMPDGPGKSIWGAPQKQWLMDTLVSSDATFKVLISPTPMIGPDDLRKSDNHCDVGGFQHERDQFFTFLKTNGLDKQNFFMVCGDRHWQYHALDSTGLEEFSCGALVDANSRLGRMPGDPKGTDPQGLIKHLYSQTERSGGFLMISCDPASSSQGPSLSFDFHDERGALLYRHQGK